MDFISEFSAKTIETVTKLRCITNLSELPRSPTNISEKTSQRNNNKVLGKNEIDNKQFKRPVGLQKPPKKLIFSTENIPLQKDLIDQNMVKFIYNKENVEFQPKLEQKRHLVAQNAIRRKNLVTNRVESVNIRRIIDQEKHFEVPLGVGHLSHDYGDGLSFYSGNNPSLRSPLTNFQTGSFVETSVASNDFSYDPYLQNQTAIEIPQFEEHFQSNRNAMVRQSASSAIGATVMFSTSTTDESKNYGSIISKENLDVSTKIKREHQKHSRRHENFQPPRSVCEFIMTERHAELLMEIAQNNELLERLSSFFGFRELRNFWICSKKIYNKKKLFKKQLRNLMIKIGMSNKLRPDYWFYTSKAYNIFRFSKISYYYDLTFAPCPCEKDIKKDIDRTFCLDKQFKENQGQIKLYRILRAFATQYKEIGYVQGVNYLAATFLALYSESDSFFLLSALFENFGLKDLYSSNMEGLRIHALMFDYLMEFYFPDLFNYLQSQDINALSYFTQWISTLFAYDLNREMVFKIWDLFLLDKWKIIYKIGLVIMKSKRQQIYKLAPDEIPHYLRQIHKKSDFDFNKLIIDTAEIKISNRLLRELKNKISSGIKLKRIQLRFDLKKGKCYWEFEEGTSLYSTSPKIMKKRTNLTIESQDSKNDSGIFSSFLNVIKSQLPFAPKTTKHESKKLIDQAQSGLGIFNFGCSGKNKQDTSKKTVNLSRVSIPQLEEPSQNSYIEVLSINSVREPVPEYRQFRETKANLFEISFSKEIIQTQKIGPPNTCR